MKDLIREEVFYPFSMLHESESLTIESSLPSSRDAGFAPTHSAIQSDKELFAAGNTYPSTNSAIETLALDKKL